MIAKNKILQKKVEKWTLIFSLLVGLYQTSAQDLNVQEVVESFRTTYNVPAIAASVIVEDTIYFGISGYKNMDLKNKVDCNSKFHLGSNAKAITATIAANLVEEGIIDWDTKLVEVIPELRNQIHPSYSDINLQDLLSNRARIHAFEDDGSKEWRNIPKSIRTASDQKLELARYALTLKPVKWKKAKNHYYSNGGFIIAALMLERRSGLSWEKLSTSLFTNLGLEIYKGFPNQEKIGETQGHKKKGKSYEPVVPEDEYSLDSYFTPAGNQSMSIADLSKFIQLHLKGLMGTDSFLKSESFKKMHFGAADYALGWYNGNIGDTQERFSYHGGSLGTFSSAIILSADRKIAIVILVNADNEEVTALKTELRTTLWDAYGTKE